MAEYQHYAKPCNLSLRVELFLLKINSINYLLQVNQNNMPADYLLHESSVGFAIFKVIKQTDTVGNRLKEVQDSVQVGKLVLPSTKVVIDLYRIWPSLGNWCSLSASRLSSKRDSEYSTTAAQMLIKDRGAAQALENANDISEGIVTDYLRSLLEINLPKAGKKNKVTLGVSERTLAGSIKAAFPGVECETGDTEEVVQDLLRGIRLHAPKLLKQLQDGDVERAQLGLGHAYSRAKVKFSVQRNDNNIMQAIATLDHLGKLSTSFSPEKSSIIGIALTVCRQSDKHFLNEAKGRSGSFTHRLTSCILTIGKGVV